MYLSLCAVTDAEQTVGSCSPSVETVKNALLLEEQLTTVSVWLKFFYLF